MPPRRRHRGEQQQVQAGLGTVTQSELQDWAANQYKFINPYTFVPFPDEIKRTKPEGHEKFSLGNYSGRLTINWTTVTPLMLPPEWTVGDKVIIPGSSIKGAVRSLHETLAGGCLRVFDSEFVPVYRQGMDAAAKEDDGWMLAEVRLDEKSGQPLVYPASETVWVESSQVLKGNPAPETNDRYTIENYQYEWQSYSKKPVVRRRHLKDDSRVIKDENGEWYILVSDEHARQPSGHYFYTMGKAGKDLVELSPSVLAKFRRSLAGVDDLRPARIQERDGKPDCPVEFNGELMGYRHVASQDKWPNIIWVKVAKDSRGKPSIIDMSLAAIWRVEGKFPAKSRVVEDLLPCSDPDKLCPSCKIFGMADTSGKSGSAEQRSYASHIQFMPAHLSEYKDSVFEKKSIRGMMSPHPGFGAFYLQLDGKTDKAAQGEEPTSHWGAIPDGNGEIPRKLRGRKYYWHATPCPDPPGVKRVAESSVATELSKWHRWYTQQSGADQISRAFTDGDNTKRDEKDSERWLLLQNNTFRSQIMFENLTKEDLGGLIASLEPHRLLGLFPELAKGRKFATHLGGGKPLGLGSVRSKIIDIQFEDEGRYFDSGTSQSLSDWKKLAEDAVEIFRKGNESRLRKQWEALAHVLDIHKVDPNLVWYPPGADRRHFLDADGQFDKSYEFFVATSGGYREGDMYPLPDPTADDQTIPIKNKH